MHPVMQRASAGTSCCGRTIAAKANRMLRVTEGQAKPRQSSRSIIAAPRFVRGDAASGPRGKAQGPGAPRCRGCRGPAAGSLEMSEAYPLGTYLTSTERVGDWHGRNPSMSLPS